MSSPRTYYTLLAIDQHADPREIEKAYKRQALIHHPDRNPNDSQTQSTNKFQKLAEAYQVLRDPVARRKYDLKLANTLQSATPNGHSNRPTNQPKRSSTFDLFAYPGESPRYVPPPSRRPASTLPGSRPRAGSSSAQQPSLDPMTSKSQSHRHCSGSGPLHHRQQTTATSAAALNKPFTQKINLKDLDSLDFILNMGLHPHPQKNNPSIPSSTLKTTQARPASQNSSFNPSHSRNMSSSAPDPYLTFERAWGQSLDGIVNGIANRTPDPRRYPTNKKSNTEPIPLPTATAKARSSVHRSATVRSADSDYRSSSSFDHSQRRPRSAGGEEPLQDWLPLPKNCTSPQRLSTRSSQESRAMLDEDRLYLPSSYHAPNRRMSAGHDTFYHHPTPAHHPQPRLYRHATNTDTASIRRAPTSPSTVSSPPVECPSNSSSSSHHHHRNRSRASTVNYPSNPLAPQGNNVQQQQQQPLSREFREVIIRFERESDGSTRLSREIKSRTVDLDGTVHDRYRRQRAAAVI